MPAEQITLEVAYAKPDEQTILKICVPLGITLGAAIEHSGILQRYPEIDLALNAVGIFGKLAKLDDIPSTGDRIEIYRPLIADPKEQRKQRAAAGKTMRKRTSS